MQFILPTVIAFLITFSVTPLVIKFADKLNLIDNPLKRPHPAHTHTGNIPRAGGLALFLGILIPSLILLNLTKALIGILIAAGITVFIGIWDDKKDMSPYLRFIGNIATATIVVGAGIGVPFVTNPIGGIIHLDTLKITFHLFGTHSLLVWADLFAIIWLTWTMNIVGWSSGVDGQMPGFIAICAAALGFMSLKFSAHDISQTSVAALAFITAGSFLGFLPWNFFPQKIMPGYGGKTLAGLMIATLAILSGNKVGSAILVLAVPILDAVYILARRIKGGKSPFKADRNHFHHLLLDLGWNKRRIALFYWFVSAILALSTLTLNSTQKVFIFLLIGLFIGGAVVIFGRLIEKNHQPES